MLSIKTILSNEHSIVFRATWSGDETLQVTARPSRIFCSLWEWTAARRARGRTQWHVLAAAETNSSSPHNPSIRNQDRRGGYKSDWDHQPARRLKRNRSAVEVEREQNCRSEDEDRDEGGDVTPLLTVASLPWDGCWGRESSPCHATSSLPTPPHQHRPHCGKEHGKDSAFEDVVRQLDASYEFHNAADENPAGEEQYHDTCNRPRGARESLLPERGFARRNRNEKRGQEEKVNKRLNHRSPTMEPRPQTRRRESEDSDINGGKQDDKEPVQPRNLSPMWQLSHGRP